MTKFPLSMGYEMEVVKNKAKFSRRYDEIFKAMPTLLNALEALEPKKNRRAVIMSIALFKETPDDKEDTPIRFIFELTKSGWKFVGLDNINE